MKIASQRRKDFIATAISELDENTLSQIKKIHEHAGSETKYFNAEKWLHRKFDAALSLGLTDGPPISILDLGTGPAHFPFVCKKMGHRVVALDQPDIPVYDAICAWLGVEKVNHQILPGVPLPPLEGPFDLITAFMLGFNTRPTGDLFSIDDWAFFLDDLRDNHLAPRGRVLLKMIGQKNRVGLHFEDPPLQAFFISRGATLLPNRTLLFEQLH
ncbi:MAG: class I SAM-dependent methyltransferase [Rhodospirillum sp.]|nr:class I SAM-dependent methyltransferase [Rhodospirillum sp.]MCF8490886.1 class I SAM-dependent methyltransferase [Rhodospirillum sp.]MCF8499936.1 class I SAM-dependent methyltransferase [Rhodospirillum sp.]